LADRNGLGGGGTTATAHAQTAHNDDSNDSVRVRGMATARSRPGRLGDWAAGRLGDWATGDWRLAAVVVVVVVVDRFGG